MKKIKKETGGLIFVVDDNEIFAETVKLGLENKFDNDIVAFNNGKDLVEALVLKPQLIILDYELDIEDNEYGNGMVILDKVMKICPGTPVIILSDLTEIHVAKKLLLSGASDLIVKDDNFFDNLINSLNDIKEAVSLEKKIQLSLRNANQYKQRLINIGLTLVIMFSLLYLFAR